MELLSPQYYQPQCLRWFRHFKRQIAAILPQARIEHIGSSAIPGALSKGDLDIFIGLSQSEIDKAVPLLAALGFAEKLETLRTQQLCMLEHIELPVALQLVANGSEFEFFLLFRDRLRANPQWLAQYNRLKQQCQQLSASEYRQRKSAFIQMVLQHKL
ncbi:GrpB family protein [Ferrimonas senticii]|uniref:GrpB family protein n=1 Tax=Ferrimonas senticii TaxID=394566 RepID=UPI0003FC5DDB|nr:GrpB family protein [Ferrimonas senticii]